MDHNHTRIMRLARWPWVTRRTHETVLAELAEHRRAAVAASRQLCELKELLAGHIVAAEHPSSDLATARSGALILREECDAHGIDLTRELTQLGGA
jgi:hypothetical protein